MTPRLQPLQDLVQRQGYSAAELVMFAAAVLAAQQQAPAPAAPAEPAVEWLPLKAFAAKRGLTYPQAQHMARDPKFADAFRKPRGRILGSSEMVDRLISSQVSAPAAAASRPAQAPVSRPRGPQSTTAPAGNRRGRRRVN